MIIMGLNGGFKNNLPKEIINVEDLKNKTIAVDAYNHLYQFLSVIRDEQGNLLIHNDAIVSHLYGFLYRYVHFINEYNIHFVFVFDGKPPQLKFNTLMKRKEEKEKALAQKNEALKNGNYKAAKMYSQRTVRITKDVVASFKEMLLAFGCDYVDAVGEGEITAVNLVKQGMADYVSTQDYDAIMYNCDSVLRNFGLKYKGRFLPLELFSTTRILKYLGINLDQFIYLAELTGTDYNQGIYKVGVKRGLKYVIGTSSVEEVVENLINDGRISNDEKDKKVAELKAVHDLVIKNQNPDFKIIKGTYNKEQIFSVLDKYEISKERFSRFIH